jgi:hypothetical protein
MTRGNSGSFLPQSATMQRPRLELTPDAGYSSFCPLEAILFCVLSDVSPTNEAEGASDLIEAQVAGEFCASPVMLSRNVDDGAKNKLPVTGLLKSSRRS